MNPPSDSSCDSSPALMASLEGSATTRCRERNRKVPGILDVECAELLYELNNVSVSVLRNPQVME